MDRIFFSLWRVFFILRYVIACIDRVAKWDWIRHEIDIIIDISSIITYIYYCLIFFNSKEWVNTPFIKFISVQRFFHNITLIPMDNYSNCSNSHVTLEETAFRTEWASYSIFCVLIFITEWPNHLRLSQLNVFTALFIENR